VSILTKIKPLSRIYGIGDRNHDNEGRVLTLEFENFYLCTVYVPNSGEGLKRLNYRVNEWDVEFRNFIIQLSKKKNIIVTGDLNCAHQNIDIYDYKNKHMQPGFTFPERLSFEENLLRKAGLVDCFREKHKKKIKYTFWPHRAFARPANKGWRIDYFLCSNEDNFYKNYVKDCLILDHIKGSDHCPIELKLNKSLFY
jgi:exodeoxyribonuclease III